MQFTSNAEQAVAAGGSVVFDGNGCNCNRCQNVIHRPGSGIFTLRGGRTYSVDFNANMALADGATVGPIALALAINGEAIPATRSIATPAAAGDYFRASISYTFSVPCGCCQNVSIENVLPDADPATVAVPLTVQNAVIDFDF